MITDSTIDLESSAFDIAEPIKDLILNKPADQRLKRLAKELLKEKVLDLSKDLSENSVKRICANIQSFLTQYRIQLGDRPCLIANLDEIQTKEELKDFLEAIRKSEKTSKLNQNLALGKPKMSSQLISIAEQTLHNNCLDHRTTLNEETKLELLRLNTNDFLTPFVSKWDAVQQCMDKLNTLNSRKELRDALNEFRKTMVEFQLKDSTEALGNNIGRMVLIATLISCFVTLSLLVLSMSIQRK